MELKSLPSAQLRVDPRGYRSEDVTARFCFDDSSRLEIIYGPNGSKPSRPRLQTIAFDQSGQNSSLCYDTWTWKGDFGSPTQRRYIQSAFAHEGLSEGIRQRLRNAVISCSVDKNPWTTKYAFADGGDLEIKARSHPSLEVYLVKAENGGLVRQASLSDGSEEASARSATTQKYVVQDGSLSEDEFQRYMGIALKTSKDFRRIHDNLASLHDDKTRDAWRAQWHEWMRLAWVISLELEDLLKPGCDQNQR